MKRINVVLLSLLLPFILLACEKKADPHPEARDPIYADLQSEMAINEQALTAEKKNLEGFEKEFKEVIPQTGQIKFAQKRIYESKEKIQKFEQQKIYFELKIKARLQEVKKSYRAAFAKDQAWPDPKEFDEYKAAAKLRRDGQIGWNVENRFNQAGIPYTKPDGKPAKPAKKEGGGHGEGGGEHGAPAEGGHGGGH